ncbi:pickpocket protein 19-like [Osmia bicornis bicornis]|uniref:pickpocket protein 19-like n=1 Tax=Osmia bicornis bicornis TaxID=1437191 RepID=UPI0010FA20A1|nr:pickpocket protein 19-like [Osmia bicornis bicornis]
MSKISVKEEKRFYGNEILADFQAREKAILKEKESVPTDVPNHVGMQTINAKSDTGKYFVEFASTSSIHGLNHLVAPNRHPVEKFLAVLFILAALLSLIFLSIIFWERYQNNATVIVVDNNREQFKPQKPALFICPVPNIEESKIPGVFEKYGIENTPEAINFFTFLANVNYENMSQTPLFDKVPSEKWLEILHDLRKDFPSNILKENDRYENWVITERGLCLATRSVFSGYATLEYWKTNNESIVTLPIDPNKLPHYDGKDDGAQESIAVENTALFGACDPLEIITYNTPMKWIRSKVLQRATLSISGIRAMPNVKELHIHQRKCKVYSDGGLKTWPIYTMNRCTIECRMNVIQHRCKCRPHFARPQEGVNTCNATQLRCIGGITRHLFLYKYPPLSCDCLPKCNIGFYLIRSTEISELSDTPTNLSIITLIIEFPQVIYNRLMFYGFSDFLTGVGGAAGLYLGASVLSFVEIFYYATFHIYFYIKQMRRKHKRSKTINLS